MDNPVLAEAKWKWYGNDVTTNIKSGMEMARLPHRFRRLWINRIQPCMEYYIMLNQLLYLHNSKGKQHEIFKNFATACRYN